MDSTPEIALALTINNFLYKSTYLIKMYAGRVLHNVKIFRFISTVTLAYSYSEPSLESPIKLLLDLRNK